MKFDWFAIRAMFEAGDSISSIAKHEGMPSKQAISVRSRAEKWRVLGRQSRQLTQRQPSIPVSTEAEVIPFDGLDDKQRAIVQEIADGATQRLAGQMYGVHETTLSNWKNTVPGFAHAILAAKAAKVRRRLSKIDESADWRAAGWLMERDPDSRDEFSPPNAGKGFMTGNTFNVLGHVNLGIEREAKETPSETPR